MSIIPGFVIVGESSLLSKIISYHFTETAGVIMIVAGFYVAFRALRSNEKSQRNGAKLSDGSDQSLTKTS